MLNAGGCTLFEPLVMDDLPEAESPAMLPTSTVPASPRRKREAVVSAGGYWRHQCSICFC
jgi:hypothetical protein